MLVAIIQFYNKFITIARRGLKGLPNFMYKEFILIRYVSGTNISPEPECLKPAPGSSRYVPLTVTGVDLLVLQVGHDRFLPYYFQFSVH
jgi:hypothetical protein